MTDGADLRTGGRLLKKRETTRTQAAIEAEAKTARKAKLEVKETLTLPAGSEPGQTDVHDLLHR